MVRRTLMVTLLLVILISAGAALAAGTPSISRHVFAGGGGAVTVGRETLKATFGQSVAGLQGGGNAELCAGFWCGVARYGIYLPLVLRV